MKILSDTKVPVKIWTDDIEPEAEAQLRKVASLPFVYKHVAVMPDVHAGKGSTVGTVIATHGAIVPACVGVDIGCGMAAVKLPFKIDAFQELSMLRHSIERSIPTGFNTVKIVSETSISKFESLGALSEIGTAKTSKNILDKARHSLGTLGGGNHFIEICQDENHDAWLMLHSGSRNIGKHLAEIHINKAKDLMKQYFISVPDPDLSYLTQNTREFKEYLHDLMWAQKFALFNREEMVRQCIRAISFHIYKDDRLTQQPLHVINCHHNYTAIENHAGKNVYVTRKGAVSARAGEFGIIPGSMGAKSYIVRGLGSSESFCSCSHGAGRRMSRTKARNMFSVCDLERQTLGVECRKDEAILDEIPSAYKDIDVVMENQRDLVTPIHTLKQILCIKGE